jgi:hypothetical protein
MSNQLSKSRQSAPRSLASRAFSISSRSSGAVIFLRCNVHKCADDLCERCYSGTQRREPAARSVATFRCRKSPMPSRFQKLAIEPERIRAMRAALRRARAVANA